MLVAIYKEAKIYSFSQTKESIKKLDKTQIKCPGCKTQVLYVNGKKVIPHFRHKPNSDCSNSGETEEHLKMKAACYHIIKTQKNIRDLDLETIYGDQIADVYFKIGDKECVIECQCTPISKEEIDLRTKKWEDKGCFIVWIYGKKFFKEDGDLYRVRRAIRNKQQFYSFLDGMFFKIFPSDVTSYNDYMGYSYSLKTMKSLKFNRLDNPIFCYTDYKGYKRVYIK